MSSGSSRDLPWNARPGLGGMQMNNVGETEAEGGGKSPTLEYQDMLALARAEHKAAKSGAGGGGGGGGGRSKGGSSWARSGTPKMGMKELDTPGPGAFDPASPTTAGQRSPRKTSGRSFSPRFKQQAADNRNIGYEKSSMTYMH